MLLRVLSITPTHILTTKTSSAATCPAQTCPTATRIATKTCSRTCTSSRLLVARRTSSTHHTQSATYRMSHAHYHLNPTALAKTLAVASQQRPNAVKILIVRI